MATLFHSPFCPHSRFIRLVLSEMGMEPTLMEERPWDRREAFLLVNPAGTTPVLVEQSGLAVPGAGIIAEYLDETRGLGLSLRRLLPETTAERVEVRRLLDWFLVKFNAEVTEYLVTEKISKRFMNSANGGGPPDMHAIRAARTNVRYHMKYIGYLMSRRKWIAGDHLTYADLAAAAHLSCVDYLGDVPWDEDETARDWYARVKSRPSFRTLLADRVPGMAPADHYADLDFLNAQFQDATKVRPPRKILAGDNLRRAVEARARHLGFEAIRVTRPDAVPELRARLPAWLAAGHHGTMDWMAERADQRADPATLWPGVRSVIVLGLNYGPDENPLDALARREQGTIAAYAQRRDYHEVVKGKLKELGGYLSAKGDVRVKVFVDTAPVMEKPLAAAAGLGWQGKHTVLISRDLGNWLLLGAIYTSADLAPDTPDRDRCGSCRRCLDICPTNAFPAPYRLDARRCLSYLTIEHAGPIPAEFRAALGNRIFGCDDCLAVCPWNKFAAAAGDGRMAARADLASPPLAELAGLDEAAFRLRFAGTPIKRTGRDRFLRNVLIAIGNSGAPALIAPAVARLTDPAPLVRGAAVWAVARLVENERLKALFNAHGVGETEGDVQAEWHAALHPPGSVSA